MRTETTFRHYGKAAFAFVFTTATYLLARTTGFLPSWVSEETPVEEGALGVTVIPRDDGREIAGQRRLLQTGSGVTVANPVPDQVIEATTAYQYDLSHVLTGNYSLMSVTLANSSPLPTWLSVQYLPVGNYNTSDYCYKIQVVNDVAYLADNNAGLFALNVSNPSNITLLSNYNTPGLAQGLHIVNNIAYVADGSSLLILNVSNPRNITQLGRYISAGSIRDVYVQAGLAYAISLSFASPPQLVILNVSNPSNITYLSNYTVVCTDRTKIQVQAGQAYLTCDNAGFIVLNISNPSSITLLNTYDTQGYVYGIKLLNDVAYVADYTSGLLILNISNPVNITRLGSYDTPGQAYSVQVQSGVAYVADGNLGMQVLNVSDFSHITYLGTYAIEDNVPDIRDIQVQNGLVYLADYNIGLKIIDLSQGRLFGTPTTGRVGESYTIQVSGWVASGVAAYDNFQLTVDRIPQRVDTSLIDRSVLPSQTLSLILDSDVLFTNPSGSTLTLRIQTSALTPNSQLTSGMLKSNPIFLGNHATLGGGGDDALSVKVLNGVAYVGENNAGLHVMDVSNPTAITTLSRYNPSSVGKGFRGVDLRNNLAYVADSAFGSGLQIFNISNSSNLIQLGKYDTPGEGYDVEVHGDIAYLADRYSGLQILNVSNPANITSLGSYFGYAYGVQVQNGLAYVAAYISGLQILNVTNPRNITLLGSYDTPSEAHGVFVQAGMAYVADLLSGLQVLNVSNPSNITYMGSYDTPGAALSVQVLNGVAYVADGSSGLQILNVSNPMVIIRLGSYGMPGFAADVQVQNNLVYIADGLSGTYVLDLTQWEWSVTPTPAEVGNYRLTLIATDELGGSASASFELRVEGSPQITGNIFTQYARVGQFFNYFVPQGLFRDPNFDPISFTATLGDGLVLPNWLAFNGISAAFAGTPTGADNITVLLRATDNIAGSVNTTFNIITSYLPVADLPIAGQVARIGAPYYFRLPNTAFFDQDGDIVNYTAQRSNGQALPNWLRFNATVQSFSGYPNQTEAGQYDLQVIATDRYNGQASSLFSLWVEYFPVVNQTLNSQIVGVGDLFNFALPPLAFTDADSSQLNYRARRPDGSPLPNWLAFNPQTLIFSGQPLQSDIGVLTVQVVASDPLGASATQNFNLTIVAVPTLGTIIPRQLLNVGRPYQFPVPTSAFNYAGSEALHYFAYQQFNQSLPGWLQFNNATLIFSGTPQSNHTGDYALSVVARDNYAHTVTNPFDLIVERFPVVNQSIPSVSASVGNPMIFTIASDAFADPDGDPLTYSARRADSSALPNWLTFDGSRREFSGIPVITDVGAMSLQVIATDPPGGSVQQNFTLTILYAPVVNTPPPAIKPLREDRAFNLSLSPQTFSDPGGASLNYSATQSDGSPLPTWLSFFPQNLSFSGMPGITDVGTLALQVTATNPQGAYVNLPLSFVIWSNYPPQVMETISNQIATVLSGFQFFAPTDTFTDVNEDALHYTATQVNGQPLPGWLRFDAQRLGFFGTPSRRDTGDFSARVIPIALTAHDDKSSTSTQFNISVEGTSNVALFLKVIIPLLSVLTTGYTVYKKRAFLLNRYKPQRYQRLAEEKLTVGDGYERQLATPADQVKKVQVMLPHPRKDYLRLFMLPYEPLPGNVDLPIWLEYDTNTNTLRSTGPIPATASPHLIVQVRGKDNVILEQFPLHIDRDLAEAKGLGEAPTEASTQSVTPALPTIDEEDAIEMQPVSSNMGMNM